MSSQGISNLTDHEYDGIQEFDNPTPGWWSWIFAIMTIFAVLYFFFVTLAGDQLSPIGSYDEEVMADQERIFGQMGDIQSDPASLIKLSKDEKLQKIGKAMFVTNCAACHGQNAQGLTGPNMTDNYYMHVRKIGDIVDVISKGRNNGAMPAWEGKLKTKEITLMASYIASLRGTNQAGREPQGEVIPPWSDK